MAKAPKQSLVRLVGVTGRTRSELLISTALRAATILVLALPAAAQISPNARPVGGSVVAGTASIAQTTTTTTTINQASQRAAIEWQSFNVGAQQAVRFNQPASNAVALNRVIGPDPSRIAGRIDANGQIVLVNEAGVTFYKGAQVNVQSLIVSSANIANTSFMAGNMTFDQPGKPNARVANRGEITVQQAGLAALVAPRVANSGTIAAKLGHVVLAGARTATIDMYGDGLLALDVSNQLTRAPVGRDGEKVVALVTNGGVIRADGGTVQLTAAAADGVVQNLVRAGGKISANSVGAQTGTVAIAGIGGSVIVTGLIGTSGRMAGERGGLVAVNATGNVVLASTARVNASGRTGGGTVAIGTTPQRATGGPGVAATMTAANTAILNGARIEANAARIGNGGNVTVLSSGTTVMDGTIAAKGGALGGNGGLVEISGDRLRLNGAVDVSAPAGKRGTVLLDPTDLAIIASTAETSSSVDGAFNLGTLLSTAADGTPLPSTVSSNTIQNLGSFADVVIQATGTIDVRAPISVFNGLTIQAGRNLTIEAGAPVRAGGDILLQAGAILPGGQIAPGAALIVNDSVSSDGGLARFIAGAGGIVLNGNVAASPIVGELGIIGGTVDLSTTGGGVVQSIGVGITASVLTSSGGVAGDVNLLGANAIGTLDGFTVTSPAGAVPADFNLTNTQPLLLAGQVVVPGNAYLQSSGGISIDTTGTVSSGGRASFRADTFNFVPAGPSGVSGQINTGTFELAPILPGQTMVLGSASGLTLTNINSTAVRVGAAATPTPLGPGATAAAIAIAGTFDGLHRNLALEATGSIASGLIDGVAGTIIDVATLTGSGGEWFLPNSNRIASLGNINATGFVLNNSVDLTAAGVLSGGANVAINVLGSLNVGGTVAAAAIDLTADNISIPGQVSDGGAGSVSLVARSGTIAETGVLIAGTLRGSALGTASLTGDNQVARLNGFSVSGTGSVFFLTNRGDLLIDGVLGANRIVVSDPSARVTLGDGAQIVTGGSTRPSNQAARNALLPQNGGPGALFRVGNFSQNGHGIVAAPGGAANAPATFQIVASGDVRFNGTGSLSAPGTWLVLNLARGTATGDVFVRALDVSYTAPGRVDLFGSINGVTGLGAASLGFIQPAPDQRYTFNNCDIGVFACGLTASLAPPLIGTVADVPITVLLAPMKPALILDPEDHDNLLDMPVVAKEDY